jgi:hypothetical protein
VWCLRLEISFVALSGNVCTFDLAPSPDSYTRQACAHVTPTHIDICALPFLRPNTRLATALSPSWG